MGDAQTPSTAAPGGEPTLLQASARGDCGAVKTLLKAGADHSMITTGGSWTALHLAADAGWDHVVQVLIEHAACIRARTGSGCTPLLCAAINGHANVARLLLALGAHVEAADQYGYTSLLRAAEHGHSCVVRLLLDARANVDAADHLGCTALIWASWGGHVAVTALLLERGAETSNENEHHLTALMSAAGQGYAGVVLCLLVLSRSGIEAADQKASLGAAVSFEHPTVVALLVAATLPEWAGKRLRLAAAGPAPHFTSIAVSVLRTGLDNPELYPQGLLVETAKAPPETWHAGAPAAVTPSSVSMETLMRLSSRGWTRSAHFLYPATIRCQIWTAMLAQYRIGLLDASGAGQTTLWLPWELWVYGIFTFVRR